MSKPYGELRLKELIRNKNISIKEIAEVFETSDKNLYQRLKKPHNFTIAECGRLAYALGCSTKVIVRCITKI